MIMGMKRKLLAATVDGDLSGRIEHFFSCRGYEVYVTHDGIDCIEKVRWITPDALILDLDLQWGGGAGVLACLRESNATSTIPVIMLSDTFLSNSDTAAPVARCVYRPCDIASLYNAVESAVTSTDYVFGEVPLHGAAIDVSL